MYNTTVHEGEMKRQHMSEIVEEAIAAFRQGDPVCLFDSDKREGETDLLFPASFAQPVTMRQLRQDCGGLLFLAIGHDVGEAFGLPFLQDLHTHDALTTEYPVLAELKTNDLRYDSRSAFTLSLNHRETYTGITDNDRALTTRRFAELTTTVFDENLSEVEAQRRMGAEFRTPGQSQVYELFFSGLRCTEFPGVPRITVHLGVRCTVT